MIRVFANGPSDRSSIPGQVIPNTQKMVLDTSLLNTQHYKVGFKAKWSNPGNVVAIEKGATTWPLSMAGQLIYIYIYIYTDTLCFFDIYLQL